MSLLDTKKVPGTATPSFSPDGSRIFFERFDDITGVDAIWRMNLSGGDAT